MSNADEPVLTAEDKQALKEIAQSYREESISRRDAAKLLAAGGFGALLSGGATYSMSQDASADTTQGDIGRPSNPADGFLATATFTNAPAFSAPNQGRMEYWDGDIKRAVKPNGSFIPITGIGPQAAAEFVISTGRTELAAGNIATEPIPVPDGKGLNVFTWGARDNTNSTPSGLNAVLADETVTVQSSANTAYSHSSDNTAPLASLYNNSGSISWYHLGVENATGSDYQASNSEWVAGAFGYRVD